MVIREKIRIKYTDEGIDYVLFINKVNNGWVEVVEKANERIHKDIFRVSSVNHVKLLKDGIYIAYGSNSNVIHINVLGASKKDINNLYITLVDLMY